MKKGKRGFTILELLVVISIIAIVATLAIGAAMKSMRSGRKKRVETMVKVLEIALQNYRTQNNEWPFTVGREVQTYNANSSGQNNDYVKDNLYVCHGKSNADIFTKLYEKTGNNSTYLDPSAFFVLYNGGRVMLKDVPEGSRKNLPIGYPDPDNPDKFRYFCVQYNRQLDRVTILTERGPTCGCKDADNKR